MLVADMVGFGLEWRYSVIDVTCESLEKIVSETAQKRTGRVKPAHVVTGNAKCANVKSVLAWE